MYKTNKSKLGLWTPPLDSGVVLIVDLDKHTQSSLRKKSKQKPKLQGKLYLCIYWIINTIKYIIINTKNFLR